MRCLFVSDFILAKEQGAKKLTQYHLHSLQEIAGEENVDVVALNSIDECDNPRYLYVEKSRTKKDKIISIMQKVPFLMSRNALLQVVEICRKKKYDFIFIDHSIYGELVKRIKEVCDSKIICFFHGIIQYQNEQYQKNNKVSPLFVLPQKNMRNNEKLTVEYSDACVLLNERDNENLFKYYKVKTKYFLPEYAVDTAHIEKKEKGNYFELLFVGGYFWPNVHGITWFCENVMPELPDGYRLTIVGNGMDKLSSELSSERVRVFGRVESLDDFYNEADLVVGPIFEGEGMKTKTCEALMYGKLYYGTDEAYEGYPNMEKYIFNTKDEFVNAITILKNRNLSRFNPEMRSLFEKHYSTENAKNIMCDILSELNIG